MKNNTILCQWLPTYLKIVRLLTVMINMNPGQQFPPDREDGEWNYSEIEREL